MAPAPGVAALVASSAQVQPLWAALRLPDRARYLRRAAQAVIDELDELAGVLGAEGGRERAEVIALELLPSIDALRWLAEGGVRALRERRLAVPRATSPVTRARRTYEPLGVVAIVGAGDAPFAQPLWQIGAALLAGNGVVLKPSPRARVAGARIARLFARAGLPEGLLALAPGGDEVGRGLVATPGIAKVAFTGTRSAGQEVALGAARAGVAVALETAGVGAALVLADAGIPRAARGVVNAAFAAAGRTRGALRRAFVADAVHDAWLEAVGEAARALPPVADPGSVPRLVDEALAAGARLVAGGPEPGAGGDGAPAAWRPAVLAGVTGDMRVARDPSDGPLLAVTRVASTDEAIAAVQELPAGPGTSVWTADRYEGERIARALHTGATWLNDHRVVPALPAAPWGGAGGEDALRAFADPRVMTWEPPAGSALWWGPYDATLERAGRAVAELRSVRDRDRERALRHGPLPLAKVVARALRR
ncbi:aldehyde dehydrogenase family protein [Capillimicrobium parvum]|uniref:NAD/NADP-dependent betaine aldehyde dehydrogenase n=1 Tax=Capillimicrobium parvum TaxID=2884022 RepID=A0A9E6Y4M8_9ACTN|nr:aldehyde dehydrogenase family protein [Capillimicrobium parvum]UGS39235.1 NAD/NADP-dependent betaine aldehyde dehydrogenase [Capillimicrobium parvum]